MTSSNSEQKKDGGDGGGDDAKGAGDEVAVVKRVQVPLEVIVHPLVLLSVVDHYNRVAKDTKRRVVGVLLGEAHKGRVDITNCYAVPFDEDMKDPSIWFFDHNYHDNMYSMFRKINAKERVVGWYSTGPKIRASDIEINEVVRRYHPNPVFVIIDVDPKDAVEAPTQAYVSVETTADQQSSSRRTFEHLPCEIGAYEAEEVGVEHLLREIRSATDSTLSDQVTAKMTALLGLKKRVQQMKKYLELVADGTIPVNHKIVYQMQDIFNLSPNLKIDDLVQAFTVKNNDNMLPIYLASLMRSILALHDLINNKILNREYEKAREVDDNDADTFTVDKEVTPAAGETDENGGGGDDDGKAAESKTK